MQRTGTHRVILNYHQTALNCISPTDLPFSIPISLEGSLHVTHSKKHLTGWHYTYPEKN
jgi:hypothetical protein